MCVVALALDQHPDWPVILIGNRDEFHARAAAPLHKWDDGSGIIAGRDLVGGGTWLGVQAKHRAVVVVTNVRGFGGPDPAKLSRGSLVRDLLMGSEDHASPRQEQLDAFNGFTLIALQAGNARLLTNRPRPAIRSLTPGVHALANETVDSTCPRAARLAAVVRGWTAQDAAPATLLDALTDAAEPTLFLRNEIYGTRCSTLVAVGRDGNGRIVERRYDKDGNPSGETVLNFAFN